MRLIKTILMLSITLSCINSKPLAQDLPKTLVCYGKIDHMKTKGYNLLVIEESHYNKDEIKELKKNNTKVIAYLSLAEINKDAKYYKYLKEYTLGKNSIWNSFHLDLASVELRGILMKITREIMDKGFDGLFLDNIDNVGKFGPNPNHKEYLLNLISEIRKKNKNIFLIQNAGLELIDKTYELIDMVALESAITNYDFESSTYRLRESISSVKRLSDLKTLTDKYKLNILLIEYADKQLLYKQTKRRLIKTRYNYFIGYIDLQTVPKY